jgi:hypothetical protein
MRESGTTYAVSLNLAQDRARRDHRTADAWRRLHAAADVEVPELAATEVRRVRAALANLFRALRVRRMRPATSTQARP